MNRSESRPAGETGGRVVALVRMRVLAYVKSQRALAPVLGAFALVAFAHAGGPAGAAPAYGFAAALLFGVFAWQTKLFLDAEPDEQRRLARLSVGSAFGEITAGLAGAALVAVPLAAVSLLGPLLIGAIVIKGDPWGELTAGVWLHALAVLGALPVGALASRAVIPAPGWSASVLLGTTLLVLVLSSRDTAVVWLVPQLVAAIDTAEHPALGTGAVITAHALAWALALSAAYARCRRARA